jgi:hypothetical protein
MTDDARRDLIVELAGACERAIKETEITASEIIGALLTTISWCVSNVDPELHEKIRSNLTDAIPVIFKTAKDAQLLGESVLQ